MRFCTHCGAPNEDYAQFCTGCQARLSPMAQYQPPLQTINHEVLMNWEARGADKKIPAGICAILVGGFGVHKFIMGYTTQGLVQLALGLCGIGWIIGIIEGIIYLTKSDEEFVRTYFEHHRGWF